jgi:hypothetical protein
MSRHEALVLILASAYGVVDGSEQLHEALAVLGVSADEMSLAESEVAE